MSTTGLEVRSVLTSPDGAVEIVRTDRDHVYVHLVPGLGIREVSAGSRLLCHAVTDQRTRSARHVQTAVDAAAPSCGVHLEALRARVGIDVQSITMRRAGSSVMVDLRLIPPVLAHAADERATPEATSRPDPGIGSATSVPRAEGPPR